MDIIIDIMTVKPVTKMEDTEVKNFPFNVEMKQFIVTLKTAETCRKQCKSSA